MGNCTLRKRPWQPHTLPAGQASKDGTLGYTFGWFEGVTSPRGSSPTTVYGKFIAAWKRHDSTWLVHSFLRLSSTAPPSPTPPDALIVDGVPADPSPGTPESHALAVAIADTQFADLSIAEATQSPSPLGPQTPQ